jgi:Domain of unknown function (DUF4157)/Family of unknown function (DUF5636)
MTWFGGVAFGTCIMQNALIRVKATGLGCRCPPLTRSLPRHDKAEGGSAGVRYYFHRKASGVFRLCKDTEVTQMRTTSLFRTKAPATASSAPRQTWLRQRPFFEESPDKPERALDPNTALERATRLGHSLDRISVVGPRSPSQPRIQPRLRLAPVGDRYEQEADRTARSVVSQLHPMASPSVQGPRHTDHATPLMRPDVEGVLQHTRGAGSPLPGNIRGAMESAFGIDLERVRVHTDTTADGLNRTFDARAFTIGQDIFFRQGAYNPGKQEGQELIAHELTHVVQQRGGAMPRPRVAMSTPTDALVQRQPINIVDRWKTWNPFTAYTYNKLIGDYQTIQNILTDPRQFEPALQALDAEVKAEQDRAENGERPASDDYLDEVLLKHENARGINLALGPDVLPGAPVYTATLDPQSFEHMSQYAVIPQDPGAYASHGPYSHRLQWFVIFYHQKKLKNSPKELLQQMSSSTMKPPEGAWPLVQGPEGPPQHRPEGGGTMWDALLDRQHKSYTYAKDGITHPEMLTAAFTGKRPTSDANEKLRNKAPHLAKIITDTYDLMESEGARSEANQKRAVQQGYEAYMPNVYVKRRKKKA